ncbi:hypothetical protein HPB51_017285 [Rhipicephalus microplus]|uniref:DUF7041 domain-containing protein n=1 Tax=Rhipicephalus microplus TaxID=6941 RepID=A0A9J6ETQ0_RHIMP|nr:hypothetical protein HPB51_017285 [Rhipicephalus microplus]
MQSNEAHLNMGATGTTDHDVSAIGLRLPVYWERNPLIWFIQAKSRVVLSGVRTEQRKYHLVVSALSPADTEEVSGLISGPPSTTRYSTLKAALLERTTASQRSRMQQLLSAEELGDRWPSLRLRHMRVLVSGCTTTTDENLLQELLVQRLPAIVRTVLATASMLNLNSLASLADNVLEVPTPSVCDVTPSFNNLSAASQSIVVLLRRDIVTTFTVSLINSANKNGAELRGNGHWSGNLSFGNPPELNSSMHYRNLMLPLHSSTVILMFLAKRVSQSDSEVYVSSASEAV